MTQSRNGTERPKSCISSPAATCGFRPISSAGPRSRRWKQSLARGRRRAGLSNQSGPSVQGERRARLHRQPARRDGGLQRTFRPTRRSSSPKRSGNTRIMCSPDLTTHRGPILTVANWSGQWPGLVGMLNLNGSLTKAGVTYSTLWSEDFTDDYLHRRAATNGS